MADGLFPFTFRVASETGVGLHLKTIFERLPDAYKSMEATIKSGDLLHTMGIDLSFVKPIRHPFGIIIDYIPLKNISVSRDDMTAVVLEPLTLWQASDKKRRKEDVVTVRGALNGDTDINILPPNSRLLDVVDDYPYPLGFRVCYESKWGDVFDAIAVTVKLRGFLMHERTQIQPPDNDWPNDPHLSVDRVGFPGPEYHGEIGVQLMRQDDMFAYLGRRIREPEVAPDPATAHERWLAANIHEPSVQSLAHLAPSTWEVIGAQRGPTPTW